MWMKKEALLCVIALLVMAKESYAVTCPTGMVFRKTLSNPAGECECLSGQRARMDISNSIKKIGGCSDVVTAAADYRLPINVDSTNIKLWLDADDVNNDGYRYANNTSVGAYPYYWRDKSGTTTYMYQNGGTRPVYVQNQQNSRAVLRFTADYMYSQPSPQGITQTADQITIFAVASTTLAGTKPTIISYGTFLTDGWALYFDSTNSYRPTFTIYKGAWGTNQAAYNVNPTANRYYVITGWASAGETRIYVNGDRVVDGVGGTAAVSYGGAGPYLMVGAAGWSSGFGNLFTGDMAEVIVYNTALSDSRRMLVEQYLANKWNVYPNPRELASSNIRIWLDGNDVNGDGSTVTDGTAVSSWKDKSGNNYHAVQATGALQPRYEANVINGKGVVNFDGGDYVVAPSSANYTALHDNNAHTVCAVVRAKSTASMPIMNTTSTVARGYMMLMNNGNITVTVNNGAASYYTGTTAGQPLTYNSFKSVCELKMSGVTSDIYVNGVLVNSTTTFGSYTTGASSTGLNIGYSTTYLTGDIAELIIYNTYLKPDKFRLLNYYLNSKWGLQ